MVRRANRPDLREINRDRPFVAWHPCLPGCGSRSNDTNGRVKGVQLAIAEAAESSDHLVAREDAIRLGIARQ